MLTDAGRNLLLAGGFTNTITHAGLANSAGVELTGGSPAYARQTVTWNSPSGGTDDQTVDRIFDVPASSEVARVLVRGALSGGTDYGYGWIGGFPAQIGTVAAANDTVLSYAHGLPTGGRVGFHPFSAGGLPTGLTEGTLYYVINASTDTFQVSTTSGGAAVNVTANGECAFQQCAPETFTQQGTFKIPAGSLDLEARGL